VTLFATHHSEGEGDVPERSATAPTPTSHSRYKRVEADSSSSICIVM
jgi:hypothetical protein